MVKRDPGLRRWRARLVIAGCLALPIGACVGGETPDALRDAASAMASARAWIDGRNQEMAENLGRLRVGLDGAVEGARDNAGEAARRLRGRPIQASDACHAAADQEGCAIAARNACRRASFEDGAPLASSSYVVCSGLWGMRAASAPDGACKTKRRLNAAVCW